VIKVLSGTVVNSYNFTSFHSWSQITTWSLICQGALSNFLGWYLNLRWLTVQYPRLRWFRWWWGYKFWPFYFIRISYDFSLHYISVSIIIDNFPIVFHKCSCSFILFRFILRYFERVTRIFKPQCFRNGQRLSLIPTKSHLNFLVFLHRNTPMCVLFKPF